jgi:pimeloyl-ACP methyl ester carboxylesterase
MNIDANGGTILVFPLFSRRSLKDAAGGYRSWLRRETQRIQENSRIAQTSAGPVEYQTIGSGDAVLYAHGTPGGYDQGIAFSHFLDLQACTLISPSRPGYLRTPESAGESPEAQADMYAALLDELGIQQASIIGFSGGGPSALQFALRHPERCRHLVMIGGIVRRHSLQARLAELSPLKRIILDVTERLLVSDLFIYLALPVTRFIPAGQAVAGMLCSGSIYHLRKSGHDIDRQQFANMEDYPLERIHTPTLIIHGVNDDDVPFEDANLLARKLSHVTLLAIPDGDHSAFYTHAKLVMPVMNRFLAQDR